MIEADDASVRQNRANLDALAARAWATLGEFETAISTIDQAAESLPEKEDNLDGRQISINRAEILGWAGQRDESLAEIERLMDLPFGIPMMDLKLNPRWDFFRDDPRFVALYDGEVDNAPAQQRLGDGT